METTREDLQKTLSIPSRSDVRAVDRAIGEELGIIVLRRHRRFAPQRIGCMTFERLGKSAMEIDDDVALALMRIAEALDGVERAEAEARGDDHAALLRARRALRSAQRELAALIEPDDTGA
jgi:hypothetical protein